MQRVVVEELMVEGMSAVVRVVGASASDVAGVNASDVVRVVNGFSIASAYAPVVTRSDLVNNPESR